MSLLVAFAPGCAMPWKASNTVAVAQGYHWLRVAALGGAPPHTQTSYAGTIEIIRRRATVVLCNGLGLSLHSAMAAEALTRHGAMG